MRMKERARRVWRNKPLINGVKIVLAVVLLAVVIWQVDWRDVRARLVALQWWWFVVAVALQWVVIAIGNHRLQILLRALQVRLGYWRTLKYNCIGYFFNLAFPGGTGGDVVKVFYVAREAPGRGAVVVTAILLDRVMGLLAVVLIAAVALILTLKTSPAFRQFLPLTCGLLGAAVAGVALLMTKNYWKRYSWWAVVDRYTPRLIRQMVRALYEYRSHKAVALLALVESVALQLIMCVIAWCFGRALSLQMAWHLYFVIFPVVTLVLTIPVTPSGLGVTEGAAAWCFKQVLGSGGGAAGIAFMLLLRLTMLTMALAGFGCWVVPGTRVAAKELVEKTEEWGERSGLDMDNGGEQRG
ncbi:MAG: flippase-like domain-containing protein [bacterium]|nr:flippase-like domain-containing protein [bacterium]